MYMIPQTVLALTGCYFASNQLTLGVGSGAVVRAVVR